MVLVLEVMINSGQGEGTLKVPCPHAFIPEN
jgi:hypothetical protein